MAREAFEGLSREAFVSSGREARGLRTLTPPPDFEELIVIAGLDEATYSRRDWDEDIRNFDAARQALASRSVEFAFAVLDWKMTAPFVETILPVDTGFPTSVTLLAEGLLRDETGIIIQSSQDFIDWAQSLTLGTTGRRKVVFRLDDSGSMIREHWNSIPEAAALWFRQHQIESYVSYSQDERWIEWFTHEAVNF